MATTNTCKLRPQVNSIETLLFRSREPSSDPSVLEKIRNADGLFLAGGDQWNYIRYWKDSPVEKAIHALVKRGVPVGGTSAGLAVLSEYAFSAERDTVHSPDALSDPFHPKVPLPHVAWNRHRRTYRGADGGRRFGAGGG